MLFLNQKCEKGACHSDVDNRGFKVVPADNLGYWQFNNYVIFWTSNFIILNVLNTGHVGNKG
jgi:hypothetical protein